MKRVLIGTLALLAAAGCSRNRFDYIDIASSERTLADLESGFKAVPDSVPEGRTLYLLSQGVPVADILIFEGEVTDSLYDVPEIPSGFSSWTVTTEVLLDSLHVRHGRLYTDGGINGRMLYLRDPRVSSGMMSRIASLAGDGAFIGGVKPSECLDHPGDPVFDRTVEKVWLSGNVMSGRTIRSILKAAGVYPDFKTKVDSLYFEHRHLPDAEIYHVCNLGSHKGKVNIRFRVRGRLPLQWNPDTGEITPVSYKIRKRSTRVTFETVPGDDTFIVFASYADRRKMKVR